MKVEIIFGAMLTLLITCAKQNCECEIEEDPEFVEVYQKSVYGEWGPDKKYLILNDVEVAQGNRLTIHPGTEIIFMGRYTFEIKGNFYALGKPDNFITFRCGVDDSSSWTREIGSMNILSDSMVFNNCIFHRIRYIEIAQPGKPFYFNLSNCIVKYGEGGIFAWGLIRQIIQGTDTSMVPMIDKFIVANNVFHNISRQDGYTAACISISGDSVLMPSEHIVIENNIFINSDAVYRGGNASRHVYGGDYNCYYNCSFFTALDNSNNVPVQKGTHDIETDPLLFNLTRGSEDYRLRPESPCIGTGKNGSDMGVYGVYQP